MIRTYQGSKFKGLRNHALIGFALLVVGCQSGVGRVASISADKNSLSVELSSDDESLLTPPAAPVALSTRSEILGSGNTPSDAVLMTIAELSLIGKDFNKARETARARLKKNFNDVDAMNVLIRAALAEGKVPEAFLLIDNALNIEPRNSTTLNLQGLAFFMDDRPVEARESWKTALKHDPTSIPAMMNLGALYFENRNIGLAGALFEKIIALQPSHLDARVGFALVLCAQGEMEKGRSVLERIYETHDDAPLVLYNLAIVERDGFGDSVKSLAYMEKFVDTVSKMPNARLSMENGLRIVTQLRSRIAAEKEKLSDAELRSIANTPGGGSTREAEPEQTKKAEINPALNAPSEVLEQDVQSLEDALK